jgi:hypothetical protein
MNVHMYNGPADRLQSALVQSYDFYVWPSLLCMHETVDSIDGKFIGFASR